MFLLQKYLHMYKKLNFKEWALLLVPLFHVLGSLYLNFLLILTSIIFVYELFKKKLFKEVKLYWVYFYLIFIIYNIVRGFFATNALHAFQNSFSQIRFLFFSLFIFVCISDTKNLNVIIKTWLMFILLVCIDTFIQFFLGKDIFGLEGQPHWQRYSGPFGKELIVGTFIVYISIPIIFFYYNKFFKYIILKKTIFILLYLFIFLTVLFSGERSAFIVFLLSSIVIFSLYLKLKKIIIIFSSIVILITFIYFKSHSFHSRTNDLVNIINNFYSSSYGRLYESSYLLFKKNLFFGVGLKNYRVLCDKQIDPRPNSPYQFCSTHPHNFYLEVLTETGVVGISLLFASFFALFIYLIKKIKILKKNYYDNQYLYFFYGNILILLIYIWPIKTSGSFFTTWNGSFFWLNVGIALLISKKFK